MRVAIFTELYLPNVGGQEIRYAELAQALRRRGHEVSVYCIGHQPGLAPVDQVAGVEVRRHPIVRDYRRSLIPGMPRGVLPILRYAWWCRRVMRDVEADIYLFNQFPFGHVLAAPAAVRRRAITDWCEVRRGAVYHMLQRLVPRLTRFNFGVSTAVAAGITAQSSRPVEIFPSGINLGSYRTEPREQRRGLVYVGRLFPHKRVSLLVQAYGCLRERGFDEPLVIAGTGPAKDDIDAAVARLDASSRADVRLPGHVSDEEKVDLLAAASVLVIPSQREGFPRVVAEAMACGLPVVTTNDPMNGTRDVVREFGIGEVAEPDAHRIADAVMAVSANWSRYSANALAAADHLEWNHLASRFEALTESVRQ